MTEEPKSANLNHGDLDRGDLNHGDLVHGDYERSDIGAAPVLYFLLALAIGGVFVYFVADGVYSFLEKRNQAEQTSMSPLVTNAPVDTRKLPVDYKDYLKQNFPAPQLEINERDQLDQIRIDEENTLATYGYIDQKAGTVRIPIDRAMDLIVQRGLPVRGVPNLGVSFRPWPTAGQEKQAKK